MNDQSIFISREITQNALWENLITQGYNIHAESLIEFNAIPLSILPSSDWLYFYSQTAVQYFHTQCQVSKFDVSERKFAAHGVRTAIALIKLFGANVKFTYNSKESNSKTKLRELIANEKILFVQAKNSLRTIQTELGDINYSELEVYTNKAKMKFTIPKSKFLLLTSPLNVRTYFSQYPFSSEQIIITIGETSFSECLKYTTEKYIYRSDENSEKSMYNKLVELLRK